MALVQTEFRSASSRIDLEDQPTDINFSPREALLAVGYISGEVHLLPCLPVRDASPSEELSGVDTQFEQEITDAAILKPGIYYKCGDHIACSKRRRSAVSSVLFAEDGLALTSSRSNGSLYLFDSTTGKKIKCPSASPLTEYHNDNGRSVKRAHSCGIHRIENVDRGIIASGDDSGVIKVWDVRSRSAIGEIKAHVDYITDLVYLADSHQLMASSGDTSVTLNDMRKLKTIHESHDGFKEEGTSLQLLADGNQVVCGTSRGKIALFTPMAIHQTHEWFSGGMKIHRGSVDAMVSLDDQTIVTGCGDGVIRVLRFHPNRFLGVIGRHKHPDTVERLAISGDDSMLASIGLENCVRLWDVQNLKVLKERREETHEEKTEQEKREGSTPSNKAKKKLKKRQTIPNFFSDLNQQELGRS